MKVASNLTDRVVGGAEARVRKARDANAALTELAGVVREFFEIHRASIRVLRPEGNKLEIVAVWGVGKDHLGPGLTMSVLSTSLPEAMESGRSVVHIGAKAEALLDEVLRLEGIRTWVSTPLIEDGIPWGMLSFSSRSPAAFDEDDAGFFDLLGTALSPLLRPLATGPAARR